LLKIWYNIAIVRRTPNKKPVFRGTNQVRHLASRNTLHALFGAPKIKITIKIPPIVETLCVWPVLLYRQLRYGYAFRKIRLTQGKYAIVDPYDFEKLSQYKWCIKKNKNKKTIYAHRAAYKMKNTVLMHRQIMCAEKGILIDHINNNGLDNRKANLRFATYRQNAWNSKMGINSGSSKYKGVSWDRRSKKWRAMICNNYKKMHLGFFDNEKAAAKVYNEAAKKHRGVFAVLNNV
jgi:hypothetical protein